MNYTLTDLLFVMERLRDPDLGCPWDLKQTFSTIVPSTLEEAYEVADAIERKDFSHLKEEIGDLLFQVVFYAQLGKEADIFNFETLVSGLTRKLISRHPHVFNNGNLYTDVLSNTSTDESTIKSQWEIKKQQERALKGKTGVLDDVPLNLPSISRAQKLQKRASLVGFDFGSVAAAMEKVREETIEVEAEITAMNGTQAHAALGEELGDLLFSVVNVCRLGSFDAESLLRAANRKFEARFEAMDAEIRANGSTLEASDLAEMEAAWQAVKLLAR